MLPPPLFPFVVAFKKSHHHSHSTSCIFPGFTIPAISAAPCSLPTHMTGKQPFQPRAAEQSVSWDLHHTHQDSYLIFTSPLQAPESMPKRMFVLAVKSPRRKVIAKVPGVGPSQPINMLIIMWIWGTTPKYAYHPGPRALRGGAEYLTQHFQLLYCIWSQGGWKILSVPCLSKTWFARRAAELLFSFLLPQKTFCSHTYIAALSASPDKTYNWKCSILD